jgi:hypothetical protein
MHTWTVRGSSRGRGHGPGDMMADRHARGRGHVLDEPAGETIASWLTAYAVHDDLLMSRIAPGRPPAGQVRSWLRRR